MPQPHTPAAGPGAPGTSRTDDVQRFLDRFAQALVAGDGRTIARMWGTPALVVDDAAVQVIATQDEVERFFAGAKDQYNARGIVDTRADIERLDWPTDRIAIVRVRWPYVDARGDEHGAETSTYTLRRDDGGDLRLVAVVMHGVKTD
jgi:ketosteroid isomerase-like protein